MSRLSAKKLRELESKMHTTEGYRQYIAWTMPEGTFQKQVVLMARQLGWALQYHTWIAIHSRAGFPDLVLVNRAAKRVIYVELKTMAGIVSDAQQEWHDALNDCEQEAFIWRPDNLSDGTIEKALT